MNPKKNEVWSLGFRIGCPHDYLNLHPTSVEKDMDEADLDRPWKDGKGYVTEETARELIACGCLGKLYTMVNRRHQYVPGPDGKTVHAPDCHCQPSKG